MCCSIKYVHDSLLVDYRCEDDREVIERSKALFDSLGVLLHSVGVLLDSIPFVHNHHASLLVSLDEVEDCHILRLDTCLSVNHKDTYV